jgi:outer membrane lipoprotein-sorting protein
MDTKLAGWSTFAALLVAALPLWAVQDAPAQQGEMQSAAQATLERIAKGLEDVRELRAEYTQEQASLLLDEPLVSNGILHLRAEPGCIVLEVEKPRAVLIRSDAKTHLVYHPATKRAERFLFESNELAKALLACFTADLGRIESLFRITDYSEDPTTKLAVLSLHPLREEVRAAVRSLTLEFDLAAGLPTRIVQVSAEGEELRLSLRNIVRNPERPPGETPIFDRPLPKDVEVSERRIPKAGDKGR